MYFCSITLSRCHCRKANSCRVPSSAHLILKDALGSHTKKKEEKKKIISCGGKNILAKRGGRILLARKNIWVIFSVEEFIIEVSPSAGARLAAELVDGVEMKLQYVP